ncbi:MAG: VWA domain-containing protein [Sedimentisphaerales bacterium]|nr:VWA domain-containing protein [Sedimentisphaerales bacterium]
MSHGRYKLFAGAASVLLHLSALSVLAVVGFEYDKKPADINNQKQVRAEFVRNLIEEPHLINKPKFQNYSSKTPLPKLPQLETASELLEDKFVKEEAPRLKAATDMTFPGFQESFTNQGVSFFSSRSGERRICFLVDCSGSMQGLWGMVVAELIRSIQSLPADEYFSIVFFGDNGIVQFADGKLVRASAKAKEKAGTFIESVRPVGRTNALAGFESAVKIRGAGSNGPDVIFFLTDGFELMGKDSRAFELAALDLVQNHLPRVRINTIGFWPGDEDRRLLKSIADLTGGDFVVISEKNL